LNITVKQIIIIKTQNTSLSYTKILKIKLNSTIKVILKYIKHKIIILKYKYSSLNKEEIKLAKIIKIINIKIENNNKKIIIVKKLSSKDIILTLNLTKIKNYIIKKIS